MKLLENMYYAEEILSKYSEFVKCCEKIPRQHYSTTDGQHTKYVQIYYRHQLRIRKCQFMYQTVSHNSTICSCFP